MATATTGSPNISELDSIITADLCGGNFLVSVTNSTWVGTGYNSVQGASVKVTNPVGVVIDNYITSGFDIYPPMTSIYSLAIPLIAGNYQYGTYTIDVRLTDADGTTYVVSKSVNICPPDPNNKTKKTGCLNATITGNCKDGKVVVLLNQPPNYKSTAFTSQVNDLELEYPTASGLPVLETTAGAFSVALYEGQYLLTGTACVLYSYGDSVYFKVSYKVSCTKIIKCIIDECCVFAKLEELNLKLKTDCTTEEKTNTSLIALDAIRLLKMAQLAADCGQDPSDIVSELEDLLGCQCTCNCNEGTPIIDNTPAKDFLIEGCGVVKSTVGLTDRYDINVFDYSLVNDDTTGILTVTSVVTNACTKQQRINIDVDALIALVPAATGLMYRGIVTQSLTGVPIATVDTGNAVTITYTRVGVGSYVGTVSGTFTPLTQNNMHILFGKTANVTIKVNWASASTFTILSADSANTPADSLIDHVPFELNILAI